MSDLLTRLEADVDGIPPSGDERAAAFTIRVLRARVAELEAQLASLARGVRISIPTETMEQEFTNQRRLGYTSGRADALAEVDRLRAEVERLRARYQSAVNTLRDIAQMSGKLGSESAAHRLAQLGEPRYLDEDLTDAARREGK